MGSSFAKLIGKIIIVFGVLIAAQCVLIQELYAIFLSGGVVVASLGFIILCFGSAIENQERTNEYLKELIDLQYEDDEETAVSK